MTGMFADKVALVTGAGSGIGRAAARRLATEGARVVASDIDRDSAEATVALITEAGGSAVALAADIASEADNARMFDEAESRFGGIDHAFLNAGILQPYGPMADVSLDLFDRIMRVNLRGTFIGLQLARERLRPHGACVVTGSGASVIGFADALAYATSKHAVAGMVRSAAAGFAERGLRVNAIAPGMVLTPMNGIEQDDSLADPAELPLPDYRGGLTAQQIAEVVLFLLSRPAAGVNGQVQLVDAALLSSFPPLEELER